VTLTTARERAATTKSPRGVVNVQSAFPPSLPRTNAAGSPKARGTASTSSSASSAVQTTTFDAPTESGASSFVL